ncbi:hypothetical protein [Roseomonas sp. 18066]|uniref:hypothetical protein n=1 Tax=Roseomonas sp. 18066 TaxID=2681412 RepID=UPI00135877F9|nr:hypothetical protein [Roseomonas sp. 18066]
MPAGPALAVEGGLPPLPSPGPGRAAFHPPVATPTLSRMSASIGRLARRCGAVLQGVAVVRRQRALERLLDGMAERVAQTEIALLRQQRDARRQAARAEAAEAALVRLQDMLDRLRRERHQG